MVLNDGSIDKRIQAETGLNATGKQTLINVADKAWFRSYARKSKDALNKLIKKVKKGIKKGQYTYFGKPIEEPRGFLKPKIKKKKTGAKKKKTITTKKRTTKTREQKITKTEPRVLSAKQKYPDATRYELQHGVNSKASQQYRKKHNRPLKYEGRIKG